MSSDAAGPRTAIFLGVDGGGTTTSFCLVSATGDVLAQIDGPSTYPFPRGVEAVESVLADGIAEVCERAGRSPDDIDFAFFGLPAYGEASRVLEALDAAPRAGLGHDRYACDNDMVPGWAGSLGARDGINVICGTGSMAYGERAGSRARVGGWGELFGDEGSAYWIATRALNAASKMSDGRLNEGPLLQRLRTHLDLATDLDLVDVVLGQWEGDRSKVAALSTVVAAAADDDEDPVAVEIFADAARELVDIVDAARVALAFEAGEPVPVSYSGGVFKAGDLIFTPFADGLAARSEGYELRRPRYSPAVGSAIYAAKRNGTPLDETAMDRIDAGSAGTPTQEAVR